MPIRHMVISGGGHSLFKILGICETLHRQGFWKHEDLVSLYGTSAGAMISIVLAMNFEWPVLYDYLITRPWKDAFKFDFHTFLEVYTTRGLFDKKEIAIMYKPLFDAKDIPLDISLQDFYEWSGIDLHFFATELNSLQLEDISHSSHPDLPLLTALHMTCAVPVLFTPVFNEGRCYLDGGMISNYPLEYCIQKYAPTVEEQADIIGFKNKYEYEEEDITNQKPISEDANLVDFLLQAFYKVVFHMSNEHTQPTLLNEIPIYKRVMTPGQMQAVVLSMEARQELYEEGVAFATQWLHSKGAVADADAVPVTPLSPAYDDNSGSVVPTVLSKKMVSSGTCGLAS